MSNIQQLFAAKECSDALSEMTGIKSVRGFIASPLDREIELYKMAIAFDIKGNGMTYGEVYDELATKCQMYTRDELTQLASNFIDEFVKEFGHNALKILKILYFDPIGDRAYNMKYGEIVLTYIKWANKWADKHFTYNIEAYLFGNEVKKQTNKYGLFIIPVGAEHLRKYLENIFKMVEEIRFSFYDEDVIKQYQKQIEEELYYWGHPYYNNADLSDPKILKELFYELGEELGDNEAFLGCTHLFYSYDGYGNTLDHNGKIYEQW
jgi:hypothetical protein